MSLGEALLVLLQSAGLAALVTACLALAFWPLKNFIDKLEDDDDA